MNVSRSLAILRYISVVSIIIAFGSHNLATFIFTLFVPIFLILYILKRFAEVVEMVHRYI